MRKALLPLALILSLYSIAQPYVSESLIWLDGQGQPIKKKKAVVLHQVIRLNDTLWEHNFYQVDGPRIVSAQSSEAEGREMDGTYIAYGQGGWADTLGYYKKGKRNGNWWVYQGKPMVQEIHYEQGEVLWKKDTLQLNREMDSIKATHKGEGKPLANGATLTEVESEYPGGIPAWIKYLNKNFKYPDEAIDKSIMGQVMIGFTVDATGVVPPTSLWVKQSVAYSLDKEALRVIYESGNWTPAWQYGKNVKSYKLQPVVFKLVRGR